MKKVFLIDDDDDDRLLFQDAIEIINSSIECDTAINGKVAFDKLHDSQTLPDIIFLDLNMPFMNGFDFLLQIKKEEQFNKIPIGIFTTSNYIRDREVTKVSGANFFLSKPTDFNLLCEKLEHIITTDFSTVEYINID